MYHHIKKLMYTVNVGEPDPRFGNMLLEQFGGANGELAAAMQYSIQGLNCEDPDRKDLLMDIGTEELSHLGGGWHSRPYAPQTNEEECRCRRGRSADRDCRRRRRQLVQFHGRCMDRRLSENHRRIGCRSAQQHCRRGASQNCLRAAYQLL